VKTWVKLYTEVNHDPAIGTLTWAQRGIWAALLALAGEIDDRDEAQAETGALDTLPNIAWRLRCDEGELGEAVEAFVERNMVDERDGILYITHYGSRQRRPPSAKPDAVKDRVQRHRAQQSDSADDDDGNDDGNDDVTSAKRQGNDGVSSRNGLRVEKSRVDTDEIRVDVEKSVPDNNAAARLFRLVESAGIFVNPLMADEYADLLKDAPIALLEAAFREAARAGKRPFPSWLRTVVDRCQRDGCMPGEWRAGARASPGGNGNPPDDYRVPGRVA
jgi:hypothetical protein